MSEDIKEQLKQLTNDELIDFALEHLGEENEYVRHLALMEHHERAKNDPNTITDLPGEDKGLRLKLAQIMDKARQ
ncbi:hypothetical protein PN499_29415 [Kamptonema animale CS-326]|uniref:hypothetical protein n=1 Tax=Kamptonema TaxID=1501433 RepID=UPI00232F702D|nr:MULTISPECIES: hypothetical protein [Kamptonema]MDB9515325.1 hypothetical protein [Kamptonema animale CS-326]MDF0552934.1 hypothetical protein [Kamptonema sp. UHCC 0994]